MSESSDAFSVICVAGGLLDDERKAALLAFDGEAGPVTLLLPAAELMSLLSVCVGLAGQALPAAGEAEHPTIPVADWRVGVTAGEAVVVGLAPKAGGALAFNFSRDQARELAQALLKAVGVTAPSPIPAGPPAARH
ncbi:MAG: hypothetical protein JWQ97_3153 [Phenylobacterium sp.]|nr:hypothetical protein [Phenylobacterium sp.]